MRRGDLATDSPTNLARAQIARGEKLLWADRAIATGPGWGSLFFVFFGLCFAGFAAFWMTLAFLFTRDEGGIWSLFPYFGAPFLLVGLGIATSPLWLRFLGGAAVYALTDRRLIVLSGKRQRMVRSVDLAGIGNLHWSERGDGIGDIMFDGATPMRSLADRRLAVTGLHGVPNIRKVARDIERARDEALRRAEDGAAGVRP